MPLTMLVPQHYLKVLLLRVLLLLVVVANDLQQLELTNVHAGKASAPFPSKQQGVRCVRFLCETW